MNNLIDILNKWANRLTVKILMLSGTSQDDINRVVAAMENRQQFADQKDKQLKGRFVWLKWLLVSLFVIGVVFIGLKIRRIKK